MMTLTANGLLAGYKDKHLLGPLDLQLRSGCFVCLIGSNGAGKSTLIRTLCGMQSALQGEIFLDGQPLHRMSALDRARRLSVVLTERVAVTLMSGYQLASLGRYPHIGWGGRLSDDDHRLVHEALEQADALSLAHRLVTEKSDGERQKIMIARALAQEPRLLVLDEATAFLDLPRRIETMQLLLDLARQRQLCVLLSTHDLELALRYADTLWLIDGQRQLHVGAPEDMAMSGVLSTTFAADGLTFDLERGELRVGRAGAVPMRLEGNGIAAAWASRALRRAGFEVTSDAPQVVHAAADGYFLRGISGETTKFNTLGALVEALSQQNPPRIAA